MNRHRAPIGAKSGPRHSPGGAVRGVLVSEMEGRGPFFNFARVVTYTPQKYAQSTQLVERITMVHSFDFLILLSRNRQIPGLATGAVPFSQEN